MKSKERQGGVGEGQAWNVCGASGEDRQFSSNADLTVLASAYPTNTSANPALFQMGTVGFCFEVSLKIF